MIPSLGRQRSVFMGYKQLRNSIASIPVSVDCWRMFSEDFEPKEGILSLCWYFGIMEGGSWWCQRNCVTERQRRRETRRKRPDGGGMNQYYKEVD